MQNLLWLIPALPLAGFVLLLVGGRRLGDPLAGWLATAMVAGSFAVTVAVFVDLSSKASEQRHLTETLFTWVPSGNFRVGMGLLADPLSVAMCLFITGVGALIHMYAIGYMKGDPKYSKFFLYMNLFVLSMLVLVLGDNLLVTFLGWEGVGACSYFLISFWHSDPINATAGKKAFVTNRVGDWGFMVGTFLVWTVVGSVNYTAITSSANAGAITGVTATAIVVLFFIAATGKSAQLPLFVWLPDAMAGPTPVSALIHAATMVTSGVYILVRLNPVLAHAGWANDLIAWVGAITAVVAAGAAVAQNDIKKVLAYSTVSQLGLMVVAVGVHNYVAAMFLMITHAFFKALLFLGSGSVIHGMAHDQDMRHYGNLRKYMPITAATFIVGWLSIAGVFPLSGFWSKDEVLAGDFGEAGVGYVLWGLGLLTALLTAFYMTRQVIMTFFGEEKWRDVETLPPDFTPHESSWIMTLPLLALAGLSIFGGVINLPFSTSTERLTNWLEPVVGDHPLPDDATLLVLAVIALVVATIGVVLAYMVYAKKRVRAEAIEQPVLAHAWYIDEGYTRFMGGPGRVAFDAMSWFDSHIIDGAVNGVGHLAQGAGNQIRRIQNGQVRSYALGIAAGAVLLLGYVVTRMGL